jgi:hypothetical protein
MGACAVGAVNGAPEEWCPRIPSLESVSPASSHGKREPLSRDSPEWWPPYLEFNTAEVSESRRCDGIWSGVGYGLLDRARERST